MLKTAIALGALVMVAGASVASGQGAPPTKYWTQSCVGVGPGSPEVPACAPPKMDEVARIYEDPDTGEQFWVANDGTWAVPRQTIVHKSFGAVKWSDRKDLDMSLLCPQVGGTATNCAQDGYLHKWPKPPKRP